MYSFTTTSVCIYGGEPLNRIVKELMGSISFPSRDRVKFRSKASDWSISHIQHKQNRTYLSDGKWVITIADVSEHAIDDGSSEWTELEMKRVTCTEVAVSKNWQCIYTMCVYQNDIVSPQLHNLAWECALGRDANLSPDQSLALYVEKGTVEPAVVEAVPRHWQPDDILADFQEFWDRLDTLNQSSMVKKKIITGLLCISYVLLYGSTIMCTPCYYYLPCV